MYGKLFSSMYEGTLYGQWQAIVTLQQLVILADADGVVDMTPPAIAARTSIPLDIIEAGLEQLSQVDRYSRTPTEDGRRIVLVDDERPWGWRIVNHRYYRDLASHEDKKAKDRERIAAKRLNLKDVAKCRDVSQKVADVAYTDTDTNTGSSSTKKKAPRAAWGISPEGVDPEAWAAWAAYKGGNPKPVTITALANKLAKHSPETQRRAVEDSISNGWKGVFPEKHDEARRNGGGHGRETAREFAERMARIAEGHPG